MPVQLKAGDAVRPVGNFSRVPRAVYTVQINKVDQTPSKKHAPMDKFICEILAPDEVETEGQKFKTAGRVFEMYINYGEKSLWSAKATLAKLGIVVGDEEMLTVPTVEEVRTGTYTRVPEIQDITATLTGGQFEVELVSTPDPDRPREGDADYDSSKGKYDQAPRRNPDGTVKLSDYHKVKLPGADDIISPLNNVRIDAAF